MKPVFSLLLLLSLLLSLAACGDASAPTPPQTAPEQAAQTAPAPEETPLSSTPGIDIDLTALSRTMVYSEVYNMLYNDPAHYLGKTVKAKGTFSIYQLVTDGVLQPDPVAYACIIADATACCAQGLEFALAGRPVYPDDYPELGAEITVVGTFEWYEEDGCRYYRLGNASFVN